MTHRVRSAALGVVTVRGTKPLCSFCHKGRSLGPCEEPSDSLLVVLENLPWSLHLVFTLSRHWCAFASTHSRNLHPVGFPPQTEDGSPVSSCGDKADWQSTWNTSHFFFLLDGSGTHVKPLGIVRLISTVVIIVIQASLGFTVIRHLRTP